MGNSGLDSGVTKYKKSIINTLNNVLNNINYQISLVSGTWSYVLPISISETSGFTLSSYATKVVVDTQTPIAAGKMLSTGYDIRFVNPGSYSSLSYYIESGLNTTQTTIWISVPILTPHSTQIINMYYGNTLAASQSNGTNTFALFDDFQTGSSIDTNKWVKLGSGTNVYSISNGVLTSTSKSPGGGGILYKTNKSYPLTVESKITGDPIGNNGSATILNLQGSNGNNTISGYGISYNVSTKIIGLYLVSSSTSFTTLATSSNVNNLLTGTWGIQWPGPGTQSAYWPGGTFGATNSSKAISTFGFGMGIVITGNSASISTDWIRARPFAYSEPSYIIGTESTITTSITIY